MNHDIKGVTGAALGEQTTTLTIVNSLCGTGSCPTVYKTDRGTLVVQGYALTPENAGISVPAGEQLVEIPADLLAAAMQAGE
ncbi:hypothetical protein [Actinoplanes sp. OR16]|uniref:hypothetical protein n=1 Tax=Actinoplanes sp. OR16 TaxID=946334 RepID=UPI001E4677C0|nr:hypothetical protein [Actinoplanes sp. OR16]